MKFLFILIFCFSCAEVFAFEDTLKIPINRIYFHDKIKNEQRLIDKSDGKEDKKYHPVINEEISLKLSDVLYRKIPEMAAWVETNDSISTNNEKVRFLSYIENLLKTFRINQKNKEISVVEFPSLVNNFFKALELQSKNESLTSLIASLPYNEANIINSVIYDNIGSAEAAKIVYLKFAELNPDKILQTLRPYIDEPFADSLLVVAGKNNPIQLYSYAQSRQTPEGKLIHRSTNKIVEGIAALSNTENALLYFPFLDDILSGNQTIESIKKIVGNGITGYDSVGYYKLLVKTEVEYFKRLISTKDTPVAMFGHNGLRDMLKRKAIEHFVTPINELHNSSVNIRMKAIEPLSPQELYYVIVTGENDLYTSSYKHTFARMLSLMGSKPRGDSLLQSVNFDYFKKFIRLAANYNKLDTFLKTMPVATSEVLMKAFVANLDKSGSLEDAVDVADSYSSITDKKLLSTILSYVDENFKKAEREGNSKGEIIYGLLHDIFLSSSNNKADLTSVLGIPSIYEVSNQSLKGESGKIVQQVFFYGDEDGKAFFPSFIRSFSTREWKIAEQKEWYEIQSLKGGVQIFVNKPLDNDSNLDDSAQVHLNQYLESIDVYPSIVVHRGHSYWLPRTIKRMPQSAKVILLGSCGGYKNLNEILEVCPDASIISSKEIGKGDLNQYINNYLNKTLAAGDNLVWKNMWAVLSKQFENAPKSTRESWEDYVPPYRNLGAIFIRAYHKRANPE
ncbi:MAG: hypothetical protein JSR00_10585 [Bacteroidetes bacterium]|nr:hypothetical protein [Bacteroidota bacterium]